MRFGTRKYVVVADKIRYMILYPLTETVANLVEKGIRLRLKRRPKQIVQRMSVGDKIIILVIPSKKKLY